MAQINRVAPFLGFIFGTPFLGPAFEAIFVLELASQAYFFQWANCIPPENILVNMDECSFGYARGRVPRYCFAVCTWCSASIFEYTEIPDDALSITVYRFRFQRNLAAGYHCQQDPVSHQIYEVLGSSYHGSIEKFGVVPPWNTAAFMCAYLRLLHERRQSYSPEKPLTLLFDCAACHLHSTVRSLAKTLGLQVLVVPVHFNHSMHIFFGGSGRRQRAKLLKALFPEKHGYV